MVNPFVHLRQTATALAVTALLVPGTAFAQTAPDPKLDESLREALERGCSGTQSVIVSTKPGYRQELRDSLAAHGDLVKGEFPALDAVAAGTHDNPFAGRAGYKPAIYTMGHRNGHGLAVNPDTGAIWETEQGPSGGDEVNILAPGRNYGWPLVSYGRDYWGHRISPRPTLEGIVDPEIVWLPSIGLTVF